MSKHTQVNGLIKPITTSIVRPQMLLTPQYLQGIKDEQYHCGTFIVMVPADQALVDLDWNRFNANLVAGQVSWARFVRMDVYGIENRTTINSADAFPESPALSEFVNVSYTPDDL